MKLLLVAYFFPPCTDTGAQRPASMARHLRALGHEVSVLSTSAYGSLPGDEKAGVVRSADAQLWRARLRGRGEVGSMYDSDAYSGHPHPLSRVIVPEPLALAWAPFARRAALRLHSRRRFECVITTSPPESVHSVGHALARRGVPWVADVRDAWSFEPLRPPFPTAPQRRLDALLERRRLGAADVVTCVSAPAADDLRERGIAEPLLVPNGWDPGAEPEPAAGSGVALDEDRVSLVYTGRFGSYGRDPAPLVEAIASVAAEAPGVAARLEVVLAGPLTAAERSLFERDLSPARLVLAGSLPRDRALALQREADALLLIAQPTRSQLLNYKLFEYLAAGPPVLALAAGTEAGRVAAEAGCKVVRADDVEGIAGALRVLAEDGLPAPRPGAVAPYTYPAVAEVMAQAAELAAARARGRRILSGDGSAPRRRH